MQQFARRPEPDQPENSPTPKLSTDSVTQVLDQLTELAKQVAIVKDEIASVKSENQRLRLQVTGLLESTGTAVALEPVATAVPEPIVAPVSAEAPIVARKPEPQAAKKNEGEKSSQDRIDEEFLVDLVRAQGVKEPTVTAKPDVVNTVLAIEESRELAGPMSDDDIQRMLAEAALGAFDAAKPEKVEEENAVSVARKQEATRESLSIKEPDSAPVLHLIDDEPVEEAPSKAAISFDLDRALLAKVPANLAIAALAVPHRMEANKLVCKTAQPYDYPSLDIIADAIACEVVPEPSTIEEVLAALRVAYSDESREAESNAVWSVSAEQPKRKRGLFRRVA